MKNAKRSVIITAILAIIMCASLAAGATFALFTSSSSVNIVITSANVEVNADVKVTETWHENNGERADGLYDTGKAEVTYENNQAKLTLSNFVPTDGVKLAVSLKNESTVKIKYRVLLLADRTVGTELLDELDIVMNGMEFRGYTLATEYVELEAGASINDIPVTIVFPKEATEGKNTTCNLAIKVDAQQGNAVADNTFDVAEGHTIISETAEDGSVWYSEVDNKTLFAEINNGAKLAGDVTLTEDVDPAKTIIAADGSNVEINANGKTVANTVDIWNEGTGAWSLVSAQGGAALTVKGNGTFMAKENDCFAVDVQDGSELVIEDGTFIGNVHAVYVLEGTAYIKGGFYSVQQKYSDASKADEFVLNCYDANRANGTAEIIVTGGTFVNFNPADCQAEGAHTNFVKKGYKVLATKQMNGDVWYTVVAKDAAGKTFSDGEDHVLNESIAVGAANGIAVTVANGSNLVIEGGTYNGGEGGNNQSVHVANGATVTIKGGVFTVGSDASGTGNSVVESNGGNVVIEGGFFYTPYSWKGFYYVLNQQNNNPGTITVKGGTFVNYDPSKGDDHLGGNFVADGYKVVSETKDNDEVWYTVVSATAKVDTITADENGTIASSDVTDAITEAFKDGTNTGVEVTLPAGSVRLKEDAAPAVEGKDVIFVGNSVDSTTYDNLPKKADGEFGADYSFEKAASVTFKNMTINLGAKDYNGFVRASNLYFENCKIIGRGSYWGVGEVVFKNCEFTAPDADYCITLYSGKSFTFENCTFNSAAGKFINAYVEQFEGEANVVNLTNCVFNAGKANKAAICLKSYKNAIWKVTFTNCNVEQCKADGDTDDLPTGSKYYSVRNETGTVPAGTTVTVDGTVVWANGAKA